MLIALDAEEVFPAASVAVAVKEMEPSASAGDVIENDPLSAATTVPRELIPENSSTVLPDSAVPSIVGVLLFVNEVVVDIDGVLGVVVSIVIDKVSDAEEVFPATSVAVAVKE